MAIQIKVSSSFLELLDYMQYAFPEQSIALEEKNELGSFIEQWEQKYRALYSNLISKTYNSYLTEEEKTYSCTCKAMCNICNSIAIALNPAQA